MGELLVPHDTQQVRSESVATFVRGSREFVLRARENTPIDERHNLTQVNEDVLAVKDLLVEREDFTQKLTEALGYRRHSRGKIEIDLQHQHYEDPNIGDIYILSSKGNRVYVGRKDSEWEIVYKSLDNNRSTFRTFKDFLHSPTTFQPEIAPDQPKKLALFGTLNSNLPKVREALERIPEEQRPKPWMRELARRVVDIVPNLSSEDIFNPDLGSDSQAAANGGIDMAQFARESHNLFGADVVAMRFEPLRGALALAELRMAMLASVLTGHKLIVWMQPPDNDINLIRSRVIAQTDILYFQKLFGDKLNMEYYGVDQPITFEQFTEKVAAAINTPSQSRTVTETWTQEERPELNVMSGSSHGPGDLARRSEINYQLAAIDKSVVDTFNPDFDGSSSDTNELMTHMGQSRTEELQQMEQATGHLIYAGTDSLSPFAQLTTALLFMAYNKSRLHGLILNPALQDRTKGDVRNDYSASTLRSHLYQLHKIRALMAELSQFNPEITSLIDAVSDGIDPVVRSFQPRRRLRLFGR